MLTDADIQAVLKAIQNLPTTKWALKQMQTQAARDRRAQQQQERQAPRNPWGNAT